MDIKKLNNDQLHAYGVYSVAAETVLRTRRPVNVVNEGRRYRLNVYGKLVQVFTKRSTEWQLTDALSPLAPNTAAVVFLDFAGGPPRYYVVQASWLKDDVKQRYRAELERKGERAPIFLSRHYLVQPGHLEQWLDKWDVLGGPA